MQSTGFDAAVTRREGDFLNRWPLAEVIYGIAVTGPMEWSVRVGVYGEWGTGKTSVIEFIAALAAKDHHVVVRFNPWEHSSKDRLWQAFVVAVFKELKGTLGSVKGAEAVRAKAWAAKAQGVVTAVASVMSEKTGKAIGASLDLVKEHFSFSRKDLVDLHKALSGRRVIILIDDLDRTAPELVPEILFALKELMDIPGFSFVCAFDPVVVGKVLRRFNPGFGEGLSFLEKIIDYPRWLPPPPADGLVNLAISEAKDFAPYVPEEALREAVPLLPANPRAVRQFIRLLALLRKQIDRHRPDELDWTVILAADVLRIRYPRIAYALLQDSVFWKDIEDTSLIAVEHDEAQQITSRIDQHIMQKCNRLGVILADPQRQEVQAALEQLSGRLSRWAFRNSSYLVDQISIADAPHAVTWKEFDALVELWKAKPDVHTVADWIRQHAQTVSRPQLRVYIEIFEAALVAFGKTLREAENQLVDVDRSPLVERATVLLSLLECLVFDLRELEPRGNKLGTEQLKRLAESVASLSTPISDFHIKMWPRIEELLVRPLVEWEEDVTSLLLVIHPGQPYHFTHYEGAAVRALHNKLCAIVLPKFASQLINGFRRNGFVERLMQDSTESYYARSVLFDPVGPLWKVMRKEALAVLAEAAANRAIQENAYEFVWWCDQKLHGASGTLDVGQVASLLTEPKIAKALWSAATATEISERASLRLQRFPSQLSKLGVSVKQPSWFVDAVKALAPSGSSVS